MSLQKTKDRLKTIQSLHAIFSAMQIVTVVRTKQMRDAHAAMERYIAPMRDVLQGRLPQPELKKKVLVVITSNRGLCGNFNAAVTAKALEFAGRQPGLSLAVFGKRALANLKRSGLPVAFSDAEAVEKPNFKKSAQVFRRLFDLKAEIYVVYNAYRSAMVQVPTLYRLYPAPEELSSAKMPAEYILEPSAADLNEKLFYHYLEARFFQLLLDSQMGELAARLMVLKGAVDTSKEIGDELVISINKARQAGITRDLLEIVSAAEALNE